MAIGLLLVILCKLLYIVAGVYATHIGCTLSQKGSPAFRSLWLLFASVCASNVVHNGVWMLAALASAFAPYLQWIGWIVVCIEYLLLANFVEMLLQNTKYQAI